MNIFNASQIPGMIEGIEQKTLLRIASTIPLSDGDQIVEFGIFFGRSTHCLATGLLNNPGFNPLSHKIIAYDSFSCSAGGEFAQHVRGHARASGVETLLVQEDGWIDFAPVFQHFLAAHISSGTVMAVRAEINDSHPLDGPIALMHVDSPKHWAELHTLAERFFPKLRPGSFIVFQDFFYHWSATLIASIEAMVQMGMIQYDSTAASSMVTRVQRPFTSEDLKRINKLMGSTESITTLIDLAVRSAASMKMDRPEYFILRLYLAKFQWLWSQGRFEAGSNALMKVLSSGWGGHQSIVSDLGDLIANGLDTRKSYEVDHLHDAEGKAVRPPLNP